MYESPITQIMGEVTKKYEDDCLKVVQSYGFTVNKEELTKALQYDRGQYTKGYNDAIEEFAKKANDRIAEFILNHQEQLTFVSGVSYGWRIIDEVAEELKGNKAAEEKEG